jgi:hypothetical protein
MLKRGQRMTTDSDRDEIHATAYPDSAVDADPSLTDGEHPDDDELESPDDDESADDESPASGEAVSDSAEDQDDDAEDQDDDQIIIGRSDDVVSPMATPGQAGDAYGQDGTAEDDGDDEDDLDGEDGEEDEVASAVVVTEVVRDPYGQETGDEDDLDGEDGEEDEDDEVASAVVVTEVVSDPYGQEAGDENELNDEGSVGTPDAADTDTDTDTANAAAGYDGAGAASVDEAPPVPAPAPAHERTPTDTGLGDDTGFAGDGEEIHQRWVAIQSGFVDDPHQSVADAAAFLEETTAALVASMQQRESELRGEWDNQSLDTEGLRTMLRRYRAVLDRISAL